MPSLMQPELQATNTPAGTALINGTQTLASWTTPNDGQYHAVIVDATLIVTTLEVGGAVSLVIGVTTVGVVFASAQAAATYFGDAGGAGAVLNVPPNTLVSLNQTAALTSGAATVQASIWGTP